MQNDRTPAPPARAMLYFALSEPDSSRPMPCVPVPYNKMATPNTTSTKLNVECTIPSPQYATKRRIRPSKMKKMPLCVNAAHPVKGGGGDAGAAFPMAFRISSRISDLNASRPAWKSAAESGRGSGEGGGAGARSGGRVSGSDMALLFPVDDSIRRPTMRGRNKGERRRDGKSQSVQLEFESAKCLLRGMN